MQITPPYILKPAVYFAGKKDGPPQKTKLTPEQIAEKAKADVRAKALRPTLPLCLQLFAPVPEHRNGVVAGHMDAMMEKLQEAGIFGMSPVLEEHLQKAIQEGKLPQTFNGLDKLTQEQITPLVTLLNNLDDNTASLSTTLIFNRLPEGLLMDICLVHMADSPASEVRLAALDRLAQYASDPLKQSILNRMILTQNIAPEDLHKISKVIVSLNAPEAAEAYAAKLCALPNIGFTPSEKPLEDIQLLASQPDGSVIPSEIKENNERVNALKNPECTEHFDAFLCETLPKSIGNDFSTPQLENIFAQFSTPQELSEFLKAQIDTTSPYPRVNRALIIGVLTLPEELRGELLQKILLQDSQQGASPFKIELGKQLQQKEGFGPEKQVFIQLGLFDPNNSVKLEAARLLYGPLPDAVKTATITALMPHLRTGILSNQNPAYILATGAITSIQDKDQRELLRKWLRGNANTPLQRFEAVETSITQAESEPTGYAVQQISRMAYRPYIELGLPPDQLPEIAQYLKACQMDPGLLVRDAVPEYNRILQYAITHPHKLVKAGATLPTPSEIQKDFQGKSVQLLQGLILLGRPAMELAIDRKRLDLVLSHVQTMASYPDLLPSLARISRKCVSQYDAIKAVELAQSFIANKDLGSFKAALEEGNKNEKFDINPLYLATLKQVAKIVGITPEAIDPAQIDNWNLTHLNTLSSAFENGDEQKKKDLKEICSAALQGKFGEYLTNPETSVGKANKATQEAFEAAGLNYAKWLNFNKVHQFSMPSKAQYLPTIVQAFEECLGLNSQDVGAEINRASDTLQYKDQKIVTTDGTPLTPIHYSALEIMINHANRRHCLTNDQYNKLKGMLTTYSDRLKVVPEELELSVWSRNPGFDLFMGSDTGACTSLEGSRSSMDALQSTFIQMVQLRHPGEKRSLGKILLFWMTNNQTGKKVLIWNTFEGRGGSNSQYEENVFIREQCLKYVEEYAREVSGEPETPIRTGDRYNPTYTSDLKVEHLDCKVIGVMRDNAKYYLDTIGGCSGVDIRNVATEQKTYCLNNVSTDWSPTQKMEKDFNEVKLNYQAYLGFDAETQIMVGNKANSTPYTLKLTSPGDGEPGKDCFKTLSLINAKTSQTTFSANVFIATAEDTKNPMIVIDHLSKMAIAPNLTESEDFRKGLLEIMNRLGSAVSGDKELPVYALGLNSKKELPVPLTPILYSQNAELQTPFSHVGMKPQRKSPRMQLLDGEWCNSNLIKKSSDDSSSDGTMSSASFPSVSPAEAHLKDLVLQKLSPEMIKRFGQADGISEAAIRYGQLNPKFIEQLGEPPVISEQAPQVFIDDDLYRNKYPEDYDGPIMPYMSHWGKYGDYNMKEASRELPPKKIQKLLPPPQLSTQDEAALALQKEAALAQLQLLLIKGPMLLKKNVNKVPKPDEKT